MVDLEILDEVNNTDMLTDEQRIQNIMDLAIIDQANNYFGRYVIITDPKLLENWHTFSAPRVQHIKPIHFVRVSEYIWKTDNKLGVLLKEICHL